jgi:predicted O-methyltransferase YrrM
MNSIETFLEKDIWFDYAYFYDFIASHLNYKVFVEVGVYKGHSISYLTNLLQKNHENFNVYAVDTWNNDFIAKYISCEFDLYEAYNYNLKKQNIRNKIIDIRNTSVAAAEMFTNNSVDFVFIDADHEYQAVVNDISAWNDKVKVGGIIAGHDYNQPTCGVKKAVDEIFQNNVKFYGTIWYIQK